MSKHFDEASKQWDSKSTIQDLSKNISQAILDNTVFTEKTIVMDFGAGTGLISSHIVDKVRAISAVDISQAMLEQLTKKDSLKDKVTAFCQDISYEPLDHKVDTIVSAMALHHVEDTKNILESFYSHLNDKGSLSLADLDSEDGSFHPPEAQGVFHKGFNRRQLQNLLEEVGFKQVKFTTAYNFIKEDKTNYPIFLVTAHKSL